MAKKSTLLFVSSGQRKQYRDDMFRSLAMPAGAHLRFRYKWRHLPDSFAPGLRDDSYSGRKSILAYLEAEDQTASTVLIPCRNAVLTRSEAIGEYVALDFELRDFVYAEDLDGFRRYVNERSPDRVPVWDSSGEEPELIGSWVHQLDQCPKSCRSGMKHETWQAITKQFAAQAGFSDHLFFYRVDRLRNLNSKRDKVPKSGSYRLRASRDYRLRIIHYDPRDKLSQAGASDDSFWVLVRCEGDGLLPVSSKELAIDSPYDLHEVGFRTPNHSNRERALISIYRINALMTSPNLEMAVKDFDLSVDVKGNTARTLGIAVFVGVLLGCQHLISMSKAPGGLDWNSGLLAVVIGIGAAVIAAFGLRKPS